MLVCPSSHLPFFLFPPTNPYRVSLSARLSERLRNQSWKHTALRSFANSVAVRTDAGDQLVNQMARRVERINKGPAVFSGLVQVFWTWVSKT